MKSLAALVTGIFLACAWIGWVGSQPAAAAQLTAPGSAAFGLDGLEVITYTTPVNTDTPKFATALCPAGKVAVGGGATVTGLVNGVTLIGSWPQVGQADSGWVAEAADLQTTNQAWGLQVDVICLPAAALEAQYQVYTATTALDSSNAKLLAAVCPPGAWVMGGGARVTGILSGPGLSASSPEGASPSYQWLAAAREVVETADNWALQAYALCSQTAPYRIVTKTQANDTSSSKSLSAACPAGRKLVGGGARIEGTSAGNALITNAPTLIEGQPQAWQAAGQKVIQGASLGAWGLRVDLFCEPQRLFLPLLLR